MSIFSFLVAAGFEPTSLSLRSGYINRYPILNPPSTIIDLLDCPQGVCAIWKAIKMIFSMNVFYLLKYLVYSVINSNLWKTSTKDMFLYVRMHITGLGVNPLLHSYIFIAYYIHLQDQFHGKTKQNKINRRCKQICHWVMKTCRHQEIGISAVLVDHILHILLARGVPILLK